MKNLLVQFLDQKTYRKTPHFPVNLKYVNNTLPQISRILIHLDFEFQKISKRGNEKQKFLLFENILPFKNVITRI